MPWARIRWPSTSASNETTAPARCAPRVISSTSAIALASQVTPGRPLVQCADACGWRSWKRPIFSENRSALPRSRSPASMIQWWLIFLSPLRAMMPISHARRSWRSEVVSVPMKQMSATGDLLAAVDRVRDLRERALAFVVQDCQRGVVAIEDRVRHVGIGFSQASPFPDGFGQVVGAAVVVPQAHIRSVSRREPGHRPGSAALGQVAEHPEAAPLVRAAVRRDLAQRLVALLVVAGAERGGPPGADLRVHVKCHGWPPVRFCGRRPLAHGRM